MRKVFITGGAGFIGSHLVDRLAADLDNHIVVYDNLYNGKLINICAHRSNPNIIFIEGDIRDYEQLHNALENVDVLYHLAALSNVMNAANDWDYSFSTNVIGTYNVLKAAQTNNAGKIIFISSREVYGEPRYLPVDENHPLDCKNSYGASKITGETYCNAFRTQFNITINILRLANVYGERDFGRVIPIWLEQASKGDDLIIYGGKQIIDFVWIDSVIDALVKMIHTDIGEEPVNIGSGKGTLITDLAKKIQSLSPKNPKIIIMPERKVEVVQYIADVSKMIHILGIQPPEDPLFALAEMMKAH